MYILKFGGSSVADADRIRRVRAIVARTKEETAQHVVVVVSALQGVTNALLALAHSAESRNSEWRAALQSLSDLHFNIVRTLLPIETQSRTLSAVKVICNELDEMLQGIERLREASPKVRDVMLSFGERLSAKIIADYFAADNLPAEFVDAREILIGTQEFGNSRVIEKESTPKVKARFKNAALTYVVTGFIGATEKGETVTFGRGGSDYTAAVLGALCDTAEIQIWTDVDGFLTADPRKVENAFTIPELSYEEALELSHFGAKVIYPPTIQPALAKKIPIRVLNSFRPESRGSLISHRAVQHETLITGISSIPHVALVLLQGTGLIGVAGIARRFFSALAASGANVILISQASSEHSICAAVSGEHAESAAAALADEFKQEIAQGIVDPAHVEKSQAIVSIVGENMRHRPGISGLLFSAFGKAGVNIAAIAQGSSELNISVVIRGTDETKALNVVHDAFFLADRRVVKIFMTGAGAVGKTLLRQISEHRENLRKQLGLDLRLCGIGNSRTMALVEKGIDFNSALQELGKSTQKMDLGHFIDRAKREMVSTTVFVDCTASEDVAKRYADLLDGSIPVVTANKRAQSGDPELFRRMKAASLRRRASFLFETSVGAGLPVISTLNDLLRSGDNLVRIEGVLSGTLSYIFSRFSSQTKFSALVSEARSLGYTEPDPRDDLSGTDVARKILILAREAGLDVSFPHVKIESLVPEELQSTPSAEAFLEALPRFDKHFEDKARAAESAGKKLRYLASLVMPSQDKPFELAVRLEAVGPEHPCWGLEGSDNIIAFTTGRYAKRPLVVKGPGAGAEVTAAGVFADIIRAAQ